MLNEKPIFIHANARGGSNMIMNLLLSHPDVCLSNGETHKVFKGTKWDSIWRKAQKKLLCDWTLRVMAREDIFDPSRLKPRKPASNQVKQYVDRILYKGRFLAMVDTHNRFRSENETYTKAQLAECRLLTKSLDGLVFTFDMFDSMYPDATFLSLVRNGLAVCEGFVRRGVNAESVGHLYRTTVRKMINSSKENDRYHLFLYEDMVKDPLEFMSDIYRAANLDPETVQKIRLQSKGIMQADGKRIHIKGKDREVFWHDKTDVHNFVKSDVNDNQIAQLKPKDRDKFLSVAGDVMEELGYIG